MINKLKFLDFDIQLFADGEITYKVTMDGKEAERSINNLSKSSDKLSKKFTNVGKNLTLGVTTPLAGFSTYAVAGVKYNATMESYLANLTTLLGGNQQEAQKLLDTLKEMANTTPYEATDLVSATQKMMAFGISADDSLKYLNMLGDIAMGDANKMDSLTLAFSQISASGKASMEDINQMIDQGFNPLTIIAEKTGESMGDLRDRVSAGGVSFEEIAGAFETATSKGGTFYQSMDKASQTTNGKISSLKDAFNSSLGSMTESLLPFVTEAVNGLTKVANWFANLDEDGKRTVLILAGIALAIGPVSAAIGTLIKVGSGIKTLVSIIKSWNVVTKLMTVAQGALNLVMSMNPITLIVIAIVALIAILVVLWNKCEWFRNGVMTVINAIWNAIKTAFEFVKNIVVTVFTFIWDIIKKYVTFWINLFTTVKTAVQSVFTSIKNIISNVFSTIWGVITGVISKIKSAFTAVGSFIKSVFNGVKNAIVTIFSTISGIIKAPINGVIWLINKAIGGLNKIKIPSWVPGLGGKGINIPLIPYLDTGTNYVAREGLAYLHEGEAVVPKKYNPAIGGYESHNQPIYVTVNADMDVNKFGKAFVRDIKTFSGGTKNSYNYGGSK